MLGFFLHWILVLIIDFITELKATVESAIKLALFLMPSRGTLVRL